MYTNFMDFVEHVNETEKMDENFLLVTKRKYKENGAQYISTNAPIRHKVLSFIDSKGSVKEHELQQYFQLVEEEIGKRPSMDWIKRNKHLVKTGQDTHGNKTYSLSKEGSRILNGHAKYEKLKDDIKAQIENDTIEADKKKRNEYLQGLKILA